MIKDGEKIAENVSAKLDDKILSTLACAIVTQNLNLSHYTITIEERLVAQTNNNDTWRKLEFRNGQTAVVRFVNPLISR